MKPLPLELVSPLQQRPLMKLLSYVTTTSMDQKLYHIISLGSVIPSKLPRCIMEKETSESGQNQKVEWKT